MNPESAFHCLTEGDIGNILETLNFNWISDLQGNNWGGLKVRGEKGEKGVE